MKQLYLLLLCCGFFTSAQTLNIEGLLQDQTTKEPIISASIGVKDAATGTISNEEGRFRLTAPASAQIIVSCLGYQSLTLAAADFPPLGKTIFLQPSEEKLEEVLVTKIPLHQMLAQAIAASTARLNKPILLHTYYREFAKDNGKYTRFADGLLDYHIGGNTKKTTSELAVLQNRSANLIPPNEEDNGLGSVLSVQHAVSYHYNMTFLSDNIIASKKYEQYDMTLKSRREGDTELFMIVFEPKEDVAEFLYKGVVTFDPKTQLIYDINMHAAPSHLAFARTINLIIARVSILDVKLHAGYKMVGNNYVLGFNNRFVKVRVFNKKHSELLESRSDLVVTHFEKDKPYDKALRFKEKFLYRKPTQFQSKFWETSNAIVLTADEQQIIRSLETTAP